MIRSFAPPDRYKPGPYTPLCSRVLCPKDVFGGGHHDGRDPVGIIQPKAFAEIVPHGPVAVRAIVRPWAKACARADAMQGVCAVFREELAAHRAGKELAAGFLVFRGQHP